MSEPPGLLAHRRGDDVAVAVRDLPAGPALVGFLDVDDTATTVLSEPIPLGHKAALRDAVAGAGVVEYGVVIGILTQPVSEGSLVHVHNLRSARWPQGT